MKRPFFRAPRTLTVRLIASVVALVALVGFLVAASATVVMREYLYSRLDNQVADAYRRTGGPRLDNDRSPFDRSPGERRLIVQPGTLAVYVPSGGGDPVGLVARFGRSDDGDDFRSLSSGAARRISRIAADGEGHTVSVRGQSYRVLATTDAAGNPLVIGLPTRDIDETVAQMALFFGLLTLSGVGVAAALGNTVVRRQLRPLREVADAAREVTTQDLSRGDTEIATRVPDDLTDPRTEVGQVGNALNTLLDHVDSALSARHRSEQQVRQFVADASHELRTPLSTIQGYAELSRRSPDDLALLGNALDKVETEAGRMSALVEDLLLLARLDAGRPLARAEVDLTRLLLEAVADAQVVAPDHQWRLDLPDEPITVTGDDARLHQVVSNLLTNARHHTPAGTTVTVGVRASGQEVVISVHDDGPGLPPELVAGAFERFTRGDSSRTRSSGGAGLGLSLVSAITAAHGGSASVESTAGNTTFLVRLPRE